MTLVDELRQEEALIQTYTKRLEDAKARRRELLQRALGEENGAPTRETILDLSETPEAIPAKPPRRPRIGRAELTRRLEETMREAPGSTANQIATIADLNFSTVRSRLLRRDRVDYFGEGVGDERRWWLPGDWNFVNGPTTHPTD